MLTHYCSHLLLLLALSHWPIVFLLVEDLLHLSILQIVQLSHCILGPLDKVDENTWRPLSSHKVMLGRNTYGTNRSTFNLSEVE